MRRFVFVVAVLLSACSPLDVEEDVTAEDILSISVEPSTLPADGDSTAVISVHADAETLKDTLNVTIRTTRGRLATVGSSQPGATPDTFTGDLDPAGNVAVHLIAGQDFGHGVVGVTVGDFASSATFELVPSLPTFRPVVELDRTTITPAQNLTATIRLLRPGQTGKVSTNVPVDLETDPPDALSFPPIVTVDASGNATATIAAAAFMGTATLTFSTTLADGSIGETTKRIVVTP